jgi:hypothetical protein
MYIITTYYNDSNRYAIQIQTAVSGATHFCIDHQLNTRTSITSV